MYFGPVVLSDFDNTVYVIFWLVETLKDIFNNQNNEKYFISCGQIQSKLTWNRNWVLFLRESPNLSLTISLILKINNVLSFHAKVKLDGKNLNELLWL